VVAEAEAQGYRPHWTARALAEGRSRTLWFLLPDLEHPVEREPAVFAGRWLVDRGYDLLLGLHHNDPVISTRILDRLVQGGADGALILPGNQHRPTSSELRLVREGFPVVYLDRSVPGLEVPVVTSDNAALAAGLVDRLADRAEAEGCPLAWMVDGFEPAKNPVEAARSRGARRAAARRGLALGTGGPGFGVFVSTDQATAQAWWTAHGGLASLGVFDSWVGAPPPCWVAVARQDFQTMAETAAALVLDRLSFPSAPLPPETLVPGQISLVPRTPNLS